jgi:hypothetical protein
MKTKTLFGIIALVAVIALLAACSGKKEGGGSSGSSSARSAAVKASPASDFSYDLTADGTGIRITQYTGTGGAVVIPSTIEDIPVKEIGSGAFEGAGGYNAPNNRDAITSIVVPASVEVIGAAFGYIDELTKVTLPDGLKVIPAFAFSNNPKLTSINLPASLETIGALVFNSCGELNDLSIPESLTKIVWLNAANNPDPDGNVAAFLGCQKLPIRTRQRLQELGYGGSF